MIGNMRLESRYWVSLLIVCLLWSGGCVNSKKLSVSSENEADVYYDRGIAVLESQKQHGVVVWLMTPQISDELIGIPSLYVGVVNGGEGAIEFSTDKIRSYSGDARVRLYSVQDLESRLHHNTTFLSYASELQEPSIIDVEAKTEAGEVDEAGYPATGKQGFIKSKNPRGSTIYNPRTNTTIITPPAIRSYLGVNINSYNSTITNDLPVMLRKAQIDPREMVLGVIKLYSEDIQANKKLGLVLSVGDEIHEFYFDVDKS